MRIVVAPDSFKGSMTAQEVTAAMVAGIRRVGAAEIVQCPLADGGEGTVSILAEALGGTLVPEMVTGPLGAPVEASWLLADGGSLGVVELASAAGLELVDPAMRTPGRMTTYGVGELMAHALDGGVDRLVVTVGGSASCDGGAGMAQALGWRLAGVPVPGTGWGLEGLVGVDGGLLHQRLGAVRIGGAVDVANPLVGPRGAAAVFGPQKGAAPDEVRRLDANLRRLASFVPSVAPSLEGAGAGGGLAYGLVAFCGGSLERGVDLILDAVGFDELLEGADLVITGEGRLDGQTKEGKVCRGVLERARRVGVPVVVVAGSVAMDDAERPRSGYAEVVSLASSDEDVPAAMEEGPERVVRVVQALLTRRWRRGCP